MSRTLDRELEGVEKRLMVEVWPEELEPMVRCPKWHECLAPICPLDPQMAERSVRVADEERCTLSKGKRMALGALLPWRGLFPAELAGVRQWEAEGDLARTEKGRQLAAGRRNAAIAKGLGT